VSDIFVQFKNARISRKIFMKDTISNFTDFCPMEAELIHTNRRTDMTNMQTRLKRKRKVWIIELLE